jgi:hypothetical protein
LLFHYYYFLSLRFAYTLLFIAGCHCRFNTVATALRVFSLSLLRICCFVVSEHGNETSAYEGMSVQVKKNECSSRYTRVFNTDFNARRGSSDECLMLPFAGFQQIYAIICCFSCLLI